MKKTICKALVGLLCAGCVASEAESPQAASAVSSDPAVASTAIPANCQGPEYRQMDFWVGIWDLTWTNADGSVSNGTNVITRSPFGDCVITEQFDGQPTINLKGMSVSTYFKPQKLWRQTWVDNKGGYFALYGGPQEDGTFHLNMERLDNKGPFRRMVFEDIMPDSLTWRWQGKAQDGDDWADQWVIQYARR